MSAAAAATLNRYGFGWHVAAAVWLAGCASSSSTATSAAWSVPEHAVIGVSERQLNADYWIERARRGAALELDDTEIATQNAKLATVDESVRDIEKLPGTLSGGDLRGWIEKLSERPSRPLFDERGRAVAPARIEEWMAALNLDALPASTPTRYGMVVRRSDLRTFPTRARVFSDADDRDIDRFQESALFPGAPVVIAHESRDREWLFVVNDLYAAWIDAKAVATGTADEVFQYGRRTPYLIVTGATAKTVFTPQLPGVSDLQLDMGIRVPLLAGWPADRVVNGQHPYTAHVIELPVRSDDGSLHFAPALLPKTADVASDYLPLSQANVLRQGFKFLGERYGWGHSFNARDCSGFVSEIYRSFDVKMPRNTRDQGVSPAFKRIELTADDTHQQRLAVLRTVQVGDLVYIPGHVMMVIGHDQGVPYVIHDTTGIAYRNAGKLVRVPLNGVSVTPLTPLLVGAGTPMIDSIYSIVQLRR